MPKADSYAKFEREIERYWEHQEIANESRAFWDGSDNPRLSFELLERLLTRSASDGDSARSGGLAKALDMWIAGELRAAGFDPDVVWPRLHAPRVLDPSVLRFIGSLDAQTAEACCRALPSYASSQANVLGSAYRKQVDVGISSWMTGPEILISTKTMGSSFGKNLSNRFEEAYGDAKNLKGRYPLATLGFFFLVSSDIVQEKRSFEKSLSMLEKLVSRNDVYDAACMLLFDRTTSGVVAVSDVNDHVPNELTAAHFFSVIIRKTLLASSPESHEAVREKCGCVGSRINREKDNSPEVII